MRRVCDRFVMLWMLICGGFVPLIGTSALGFSLGMDTPDTDHQMLIFLAAALPVIALCCTAQLLLHHALYQRTFRLLPFISVFPLCYGLAWCAITLIISNPQERGLPMLDERTIAPVTWYVGFVGGWLICSLLSGLLYLVATRPLQDAHTRMR